jgi:hypothetical protein
VGDVLFYGADKKIIPNTAPFHELVSTATMAVLRITNQKNGTWGSRISHLTSGMKACLVHALARCVHDILSHPESSGTDIISTYYSPHKRTLHLLQAGDINKLVKTTVTILGLDKKGFPPAVVSSHLLCAGGTMAMHLNNIALYRLVE